MSESALGSSVDSERDLTIADVREGSQVECRLGEDPDSYGCRRGTSGRGGLGAKPEAFSLDPH